MSFPNGSAYGGEMHPEVFGDLCRTVFAICPGSSHRVVTVSVIVGIDNQWRGGWSALSEWDIDVVRAL